MCNTVTSYIISSRHPVIQVSVSVQIIVQLKSAVGIKSSAVVVVILYTQCEELQNNLCSKKYFWSSYSTFSLQKLLDHRDKR